MTSKKVDEKTKESHLEHSFTHSHSYKKKIYKKNSN